MNLCNVLMLICITFASVSYGRAQGYFDSADESVEGEFVPLERGICDPSDPIDAFRRAAIHEGSLVEDLGKLPTKSINRQRYAIDTHTYESLIDGISRYRGKTAVLMYSFDRQKLCSFLIDRSGILAYAKTRLTNADLYGAVLDYRSAVVPYQFSERRTPTAKNNEDSRMQALYPGGRAYKDFSRLQALPSNRMIVPFERKLTRILFAPEIAARFVNIENLIIVPTGSIALVPFAALKPLGDRYLIDMVNLEVSPGLAQVGIGATLTRARNAKFALGNSVVVGNPAYADRDWHFPDLPGSASEAESVAAMLHVKAFSGAEATLSNLLERVNSTKSLGVLYLASHAIADSYNTYEGNRGFVALANGDRLTFDDVPLLHLDQRSLVVLSACQTGSGSLEAAGVGSIARSFLANGASAVVISLWNIDDNSAKEIMTRFMVYVANDRAIYSPAQALRQAIILTRSERPEIANWAAFELFSVEQFEQFEQ